MNYDIVDRLRDLRSCTADEAANLIDALRKANSEVMATGIKSVRDTAELAIELRETKAERDKMAHQLDEYRESFANMARERDLLWEDLERVTKERDEARRMACEALAAGDDDEASEYAKLRNWDCFAHTDGASSPEIPDNSREAP